MDIPKSGAALGPDGVRRCWWCGADPVYVDYHDSEWGRPMSGERALFEQLTLEGFQSGLSWLIILRKRENFRRAFRDFDPHAIARFNARSIDRLLDDAGIVRHRGKIEAAINNARRYVDLVDEFGSFAAYVWSYEPERSTRLARLDWPSLVSRRVAPEATAMSKDLRRRGWAFVGPTTVHSFMEAAGLVNDHVTACSLRAEVESSRQTFARPDNDQPSPR